MKKTQRKRISLAAEAIRVLSDNLDQVTGGGPTQTTLSCNPGTTPTARTCVTV